MRLRKAIIPARVKAQVVKKPKAVCRRLSEECMVDSCGRGLGHRVMATGLARCRGIHIILALYSVSRNTQSIS